MSHIETLFNHEFAQNRPERTSDGQGGWIVSMSNVGTIRGRLRPASSEERSVAAQEQRRLSHVFYCAAGEDICRGDCLSADGITVEVLAVREPSRAGHHLECECYETQREGQS